MDITTFQVMLQYGCFGVSVGLVVYVLKENSKREERLISLLDHYAICFDKLRDEIKAIPDKVSEKLNR